MEIQPKRSALARRSRRFAVMERRRTGQLCHDLQTLPRTYPDIVAAILDRGQWIEIQFCSCSDSASFVLRFLDSQRVLIGIIAGHIWNRYRILTATADSDPFALQIPSPGGLTEEDVDRLLAALRSVCQYLHSGDALGLTDYLTGPTSGETARPPSRPVPWRFFARDEQKFRERELHKPSSSVAWLFHGIDVRDMIAQEASFGRMSHDALEDYLEQFSVFANPVVMSAVNVRSRTGDTIRLYPIMLPVTSHWMKSRIESRRRRECQLLVQKGVETARHLGCNVISLGQYTSIATRNGRSVEAPDIGVTTGNSYAIVLAIQAIDRVLQQRGVERADLVLVIAGAAGNIGRACAEILAHDFRRTILLGTNRPGSRERLEAIAAELPRTDVATDYSAIKRADVLLSSMNSIETPLESSHFSPDTIVCDVSVPASIRPETVTLRPDLDILTGGIAKLPFGEDLEITGFPLPTGFTFGCMAEGILMGFEGIRGDTSFTGLLSPEQVHRIARLADKHGFELADRQTCALLSERQLAVHRAWD